MNLPAKFRETAFSVLPVMGIVTVLGLAVVPPAGTELAPGFAVEPLWLPRFLAGGALLVVGLTVFLLGVDLGISPMGERCGAALTRRRSLALLLGAAFAIGFVVTAAEPDVQVFGDQVRGVFPAVRKAALTFSIAGGVGLFMSFGLLRSVLRVPVKAALAVAYGLLLLLAVFAPPPFVGVAFDSGGATTGPMTVPFIMAIGLGVVAVRARGDGEGGFGLTGIASVGPVAAVLLYAILNANVAATHAEFAEVGSHAESAEVGSHAESAENAEPESHAESAENAEPVSRAKSAKKIDGEVRRKLRRTLVASVDWREADVRDVIDDLCEFSRACDPNDPSGLGGIAFSVFLGDIEDWDGKDVFSPGTYCSRAGIPPFTMHATDIRLDALLDRIEKESGFSWWIEDGHVVLSRRIRPSGNWWSRLAGNWRNGVRRMFRRSGSTNAGNPIRTEGGSPPVAPPPAEAVAEARVEEKRVRETLGGIVLEAVDLRDATLPDALSFFEASTKGRGGENGAAIPFSFDEEAWRGGIPGGDGSPRLTIRSESIPLTNMLALVADMAGVRWRIVGGGVRCIPRVFEEGVSLVANPHPTPRPGAAAAPEEIPPSEGTGRAAGAAGGGFFASFRHAAPEALRETALSILPLLGLFLAFQFLLLRMTARQFARHAIGVAYAFVGLLIFLTGVNGGFMQAGRILGAALGGAAAAGGAGAWALLLGTGLALGAIVVCAEPAVWVLGEQVEQASGGNIRRRALLVFLSAGTALAVGLATWRAVAGFPVAWALVPGYAAAMALMVRSPALFTGIAFDSGGVASGPLTSTFVLSFTLGAAAAGRGGNDSFGVIALVAMMPLAAIQLMGILVERRKRRALRGTASPAPAAPAAPAPPSGEDTP